MDECSFQKSFHPRYPGRIKAQFIVSGIYCDDEEIILAFFPFLGNTKLHIAWMV